MKTSRKILKFCGGIILLLGLVSGCGGAATETRAVSFSDPGWDSVKFHNAVAGFIAEKAFDLKVSVVSGSTPITHAALVRGDVDVNMEVWTDNLPTYKADVASGKIVELGVNYADNKQGFYVPRYVISGDAQRGIAPMAPDLKTVADLKNYSELFKDEEQPTKGRIYGAIPGWMVDEIMFKKYKYYGLDEKFNYFRPGSDATLNASFTTAYEKGLPIVGYNWEPTWLTGKLDLVLLEDAPYNEKDYLEGKTTARSVPVTVAASAKFVEKAPEFAAFLKKYHTSSALTAEALAYIAENKSTYDEAARAFLQKRPELYKEWLSSEKAAKVEKALQAN